MVLRIFAIKTKILALFLCEDTARFPLWTLIRAQRTPTGSQPAWHLNLGLSASMLIGSIQTFQIPVLELTSSKWQHRSFLTSLSLTRRSTSNYPQTRHYCETPEPQEGGWNTSMDSRDQEGVIKMLRGTGSEWIYSPLDQRRSVLRGVSWAYSFSTRKKRPQGKHPAFQNCQTPLGSLLTGVSGGICGT